MIENVLDLSLTDGAAPRVADITVCAIREGPILLQKASDTDEQGASQLLALLLAVTGGLEHQSGRETDDTFTFT